MAPTENRAPDYAGQLRRRCNWQYRYVMVAFLFGFSILVGIMIEKVIIANKEESEIFDSLQNELRECKKSKGNLKDFYEKLKQKNEMLEQKIKAQSETIASTKEAKEKEIGIREYVQKDIDDFKRRLGEMQSKLDLANGGNIKLTQKIEAQSQREFECNYELADYKRGNWWYWIYNCFVHIILLVFVIACCMRGEPNRTPPVLRLRE